MQRRTLLLLSFGPIYSLVAGCGRVLGARIAVVPRADHSLFWQAFHAGARSAAEERGVQLDWVARLDASEQTTPTVRLEGLLDGTVLKGTVGGIVPDGIILAPPEATEGEAVLQWAAEAGVPVVLVEASGDVKETGLAHVATDHEQASQLAAEHLARAIGKSRKAALVQDVRSRGAALRRAHTFVSDLTAARRDLVVVTRFVNVNDPVAAIHAVESMLAAHPDLGVIFCPGEAATVAVCRALRLGGQRKKVAVVGYGLGSAVQQGLRDGILDALIVPDAYALGRTAVLVMEDIRSGQPRRREVKVPARLVSSENLNQPAIQQILDPTI